MDATTTFILSGLTGNPVDLIVYDDGNTCLVKTTAKSVNPLRLAVNQGSAKLLRPARRVMLLSRLQEMPIRGDGHLDEIVRTGEGTFLHIGNVQWELLERRRHPRVQVEIPVQMRIVIDENDQQSFNAVHGTTIDLGVSGAFVQGENLPNVGTLVEFDAALESETVRTLALVAHRTEDGDGVGLHFVEYLGNARHVIFQYLASAA